MENLLMCGLCKLRSDPHIDWWFKRGP